MRRLPCADPSFKFARGERITHIVSLVVVALVWQLMVVDKIGVISRLIAMTGLGGVSFLGDPNFALITVVAVSVSTVPISMAAGSSSTRTPAS